MLIGIDNSINKKLVQEISNLYSSKLVDYHTVVREDSNLMAEDPEIIFVNLMDVGVYEEEILQILNKHFTAARLVALHCYEAPTMIQRTIEKGYDEYIPLFQFHEKMNDAMERLLIREL